jgi:hypothetical protein
MGASSLTRRRGMSIYRPNLKTSRYNLYRCDTTMKVRRTAATLKNSTCHLTENAITFYSELRFQ